MRSSTPKGFARAYALGPIAILAAGGLLGGGTGPLDSTLPAPVSISRHHVLFGENVRVAAVHRLSPSTPIVLRLRNASGDRVVAHRRANRTGRWSVVLKATSGGTLYAMEGQVAGIALPATIAPKGTRLHVRGRLFAPSVIQRSAHAASTIRFTIRPAKGQLWRASARVAGHWQVLASGRAHRSRFSIKLPASIHTSTVRIQATGASSVDAPRPREVRLASLRPALASWYDLVGSGLACGGTLGAEQMGVAHKTLPCGTKVTISYHGRTVTVPVIDRGPYIAGREFDLTGATARALGFDGVDTVMVSP
jgi:3D (Asp-Asp-Asp) domain-containing protein